MFMHTILVHVCMGGPLLCTVSITLYPYFVFGKKITEERSTASKILKCLKLTLILGLLKATT